MHGLAAAIWAANIVDVLSKVPKTLANKTNAWVDSCIMSCQYRRRFAYNNHSLSDFI